jgi:hypothetical protein
MVGHSKPQSHGEDPSEGIERWIISSGVSDRGPPGGEWWWHRIEFGTLTTDAIGGKNADDFSCETSDPRWSGDSYLYR